MAHKVAIVLFLTALLVGCSSHDSSSPTQNGFGESELYDPNDNPSGAIAQAGHTGVLAIEAAGDTSVTLESDTGGTGFDEVWFKMEEPAYLGLKIDDNALEMISLIELWDQNGSLLLRVDHDSPESGLEIAPDQYHLRIYAGHSNSEAIPGFFQFKKVEAGMQTQSNLELRANPLHYVWVMLGNNCTYCDLSGADLRLLSLLRYQFRSIDLSYADLSYANLYGAYLHSSTLNHANLSYADLRRADLTRTAMAGVNMQHSNLSGAWWTISVYPTEQTFICKDDPMLDGVASGHCLCGFGPHDPEPLRYETQVYCNDVYCWVGSP